MEIIVKGGPVMLALLFTSLVSLTFIIERSLFWLFEKQKRDVASLDQAMASLRKKSKVGAIKILEQSNDSIARVMLNSLKEDVMSVHEKLIIEAEQAVGRSTKSLAIIDTVVTLAPLLGIFGTVIGIIQSFDLIGAQGLSNPQAASSGIAQALITTAAGLAIAMPSLIFHNFFATKSERYAFLIDQYVAEVGNLLNAKKSR